MEELIKLITTEQSKRTEAFMFVWQIIMSILLTNNEMNEMGYYFSNNEIKFNVIIEFVFSNQFFLVSFWYLFYVFLFFWGIKFCYYTIIPVVVYVLVKYFKIEFDEDFLIWYFSKLKLVIFDNERGWLIKNRNCFAFIQQMCQILENPDITTTNIQVYASVLLSTHLWLNSINKSIHIPYNADIIIDWLFKILIFSLFAIDFFHLTNKYNLLDFMFKYKKKGYHQN